MYRRYTKKLTPVALILGACLMYLPAQSPDRYLDRAPVDHKEIRLTVFYPSTGSVKDLEALKQIGSLDIPGLVVIGIYHEKEKTKYEESKTYVLESGLDWFKFHQVSAEIDEKTLFRQNRCTPEFEAVIKKSDGVIFFGGPDIPPSVYREKTNFLTEIEDPVRHYFELSAIFHFLGGTQDENFKPLLDSRPDFPILGFCLGCQSLNVGTGGSLIQDIWTEVYGRKSVEEAIDLGLERWHSNPFSLLYPMDKLTSHNFHALRLIRKGKFCSEMGFRTSDHPRILSAHHQALEVPGKGFEANATSLDGRIIEGIEHKRFPGVLGVQFHPEAASLWDRDLRTRLTPEEKEPWSRWSLLEKAPPSVEFHKKIWAWFSGRLKSSAAKRG